MNVISIVILKGNSILIVPWRKNAADGWSFPCIKADDAKSAISAVRNMLDMEVKPVCILKTSEKKYSAFSVNMQWILYRTDSESIKSAHWIDLHHLYDINWLPADRQMISEHYEEIMKYCNPPHCYGEEDLYNPVQISFIALKAILRAFEYRTSSQSES